MKRAETERQKCLRGVRLQAELERIAYEDWCREWKEKAGDSSAHGYDLDEFQDIILNAMYDKINYLPDDYTVSVGEISKLFKRDLSNIRYSMKSMERKGEIVFVEIRKTTNGRPEKRYAARQLHEEITMDMERLERELGEGKDWSSESKQ